MELSEFHIEDFSFSPDEIQTPEVYSFFEEHEFFSLLKNTQKKVQIWSNLGKKVKIIGDEV